MSDARDLLQRLAAGPVVFDGGMGTQLMAKGLQPGACGLTWNVERADDVSAVHAAYVAAGCDVVTTNTFQGSREALGQHGQAERTAELNAAGAAAARRAAGEAAMVAADVGPFGGFLEPLGETTLDELLAIFIEQMTALREGGADFALIETMSDTNEVGCAIAAARRVADWPVAATYAFQRSGEGFVTMMGTPAADAVAAALDAGADLVGANCGTSLGLDDYVRLTAALKGAAGDRPVLIQPNAGSPVTEDGQVHYPATPHDMAAIVPQLREAGAAAIGGCCGTTPDHLAAMAAALKPR